MATFFGPIALRCPRMAVTASSTTLADLLPLTSSRCTATSKTTGSQCAQHAIPGGTVCIYHGGSAPQVRHRAAERLGTAIDLALDRIVEKVQPATLGSTDPQPELRDLVTLVDKFIGKYQLLTGEATSRDEQKRTARVELSAQLAHLGPRVQALIDSGEHGPPDEEGFITVEAIEEEARGRHAE